MRTGQDGASAKSALGIGGVEALEAIVVAPAAVVGILEHIALTAVEGVLIAVSVGSWAC